MRGFFITGTDTDVGKTYVTAQLATAFRQLLGRVSTRKPIASGCADRCLDADILAQASQEDPWLVCPYRFAPAISPARAMRQSHRKIHIADCINAATNSDALTLVEGAGGWCSPLCCDGDNADLATALQLPVILVVANRLGCINHARLTIQSIQQTGLVCSAVIMNDVTQQADPDNITDLQSYLPHPIYHLTFQQTQLPQALIQHLLHQLH